MSLLPNITPSVSSQYTYQASILSGGTVEWICNFPENNSPVTNAYKFTLITTTERVPASSQTLLEKWFTDSGWVLITSANIDYVRTRVFYHESIYTSSVTSMSIPQSTGNVTITCT